jgi:hypothetical protein
LTQFEARELSQWIKRSGSSYFVEGAQLSRADVTAMRFRHPDGHAFTSSNVSAGYDTSMFRLRE